MPETSQPRVIDGIRCYAPEMAESRESQPAAGFDVTVQVEEASFWCRSRTGNVLRRLCELPTVALTGSEVCLGVLGSPIRRDASPRLQRRSGCALPFGGSLVAVARRPVAAAG
jgi:hypothetical protein